jgi:hypothetical protein
MGPHRRCRVRPDRRDDREDDRRHRNREIGADDAEERRTGGDREQDDGGV